MSTQELIAALSEASVQMFDVDIDQAKLLIDHAVVLNRALSEGTGPIALDRDKGAVLGTLEFDGRSNTFGYDRYRLRPSTAEP